MATSYTPSEQVARAFASGFAAAFGIVFDLGLFVIAFIIAFIFFFVNLSGFRHGNCGGRYFALALWIICLVGMAGAIGGGAFLYFF